MESKADLDRAFNVLAARPLKHQPYWRGQLAVWWAKLLADKRVKPGIAAVILKHADLIRDEDGTRVFGRDHRALAKRYQKAIELLVVNRKDLRLSKRTVDGLHATDNRIARVLANPSGRYKTRRAKKRGRGRPAKLAAAALRDDLAALGVGDYRRRLIYRWLLYTPTAK